MPAGAASREIFYGWKVVATAFTVLFLAYGLQFSYGIFVPGIADELGWNRAQTALPYSIYVFLYSALSALTGRATDRFGPRRVIMIGAALLGVGWGTSALVHAPWQLNLTLGLVAAFGMSVAWVPCNATVARWFTRRRGTAVAIASTGASCGNFVMPPLMALAVQHWGWRFALGGLAVISAACIFMLARFMVRDPETMGLRPDGDDIAIAPLASDGIPVRDALRMESFWFTIVIYFFTWLAVFVPFVHAPALANDLGFSRELGASLLSAIGLSGMVGRLSTGIVSDALGRFPTLIVLCAMQALSFWMFGVANSAISLWGASLVFGVSYGGCVALLPPLCSDLFGRAHVGSIVGIIFAIAGAPAAVGPYLAGALHDASGSYASTFTYAAWFNFLALIFTVMLAWRSRHASINHLATGVVRSK